MSGLLGVPVDAAYHLVGALAALLAPLPGGLAAAAAIVVCTAAVRLLLLPLSLRATRGMNAQARIAPQVRALREQHAGHSDRLRRELAAVYRAEGVSAYAGCLPLLLQWPFLSILYLLFRSPVVGGAPNALLSHDLLGAPLGSHWLSGPGPLSAQGAVFAGLFALLACAGWLAARTARRAAAAAGQAAGLTGTAANGPRADSAAARAAQDRAGRAAASLLPFGSAALAAFVPLAAGLYLLTTAVWTLAERSLLLRRAGAVATAGSRPTAAASRPTRRPRWIPPGRRARDHAG